MGTSAPEGSSRFSSSREIDSAVDVERLSGGEKEQVFLCTRLALAEELSGAERHTLVLDRRAHLDRSSTPVEDL